MILTENHKVFLSCITVLVTELCAGWSYFWGPIWISAIMSLRTLLCILVQNGSHENIDNYCFLLYLHYNSRKSLNYRGLLTSGILLQTLKMHCFLKIHELLPLQSGICSHSSGHFSSYFSQCISKGWTPRSSHNPGGQIQVSFQRNAEQLGQAPGWVVIFSGARMARGCHGGHSVACLWVQKGLWSV